MNVIIDGFLKLASLVKHVETTLYVRILFEEADLNVKTDMPPLMKTCHFPFNYIVHGHLQPCFNQILLLMPAPHEEMRSEQVNKKKLEVFPFVN